MAKKFYIKERHNPQFDKPYYVPKGQLTKKDANKMENSLYGDNYMLVDQSVKNDVDVATS